MRQMPIGLTDEQHEFLNQLSVKRGITKASILRNLLAEYMETRDISN